MAISFSYDEATNKVVVTGGTEGTPATFTDFVTADRAGTNTKLLDAGSPANDLALTYAVRPVENKALKVKCVVANKTAETDYIFITGKDWKGDAQTESIDVSAGNGSYETTKYWSEITTLDCSDNPAGGGTVWADGDLTVTQDIWGVIWDYGNGQYRVDSSFYIGDDVVSTYFKTEKELVYANKKIIFLTNSTFQLGNKGVQDSGYDGSMIVTTNYASAIYIFGTLLFYGSIWTHTNAKDKYLIFEFGSENSEIIDSVFNKFYALSFRESGQVLTRVNISNTEKGIRFDGGSPTLDDIKIGYYGTVGILWAYATGGTGRNIILKDDQATGSDIQAYQVSSDLILIDSVLNWNFIWGGTNTAACYRKYTCNLHIADKDGNNLSGVTILCQDKDGNEIFSVSTDASGDITEQTITYIKYEEGTTTTYSPHKFTISKAGYETLVLDEITVDKPIDWHLELLPALAEADVREATVFGENKTGTLDLPSVNDVEKGVQFDNLAKTGVLKVPAEGDVRQGEGYGANDNEFTGELDLPAIADVRDGVKYDSETKEGELDLPAEEDVEKGVKYDNEMKEGNLELPAIGDVRDGIGFGAAGAEFIGILDLPLISDVKLHTIFDNGTKEGTYICPIPAGEMIAYLEESTELEGYLEERTNLVGEIKS